MLVPARGRASLILKKAYRSHLWQRKYHPIVGFLQNFEHVIFCHMSEGGDKSIKAFRKDIQECQIFCHVQDSPRQ